MVDILRYGRWASDDVFVFDPPLLRQGIMIDELDLNTVRAQKGLSSEEMVLAVLRGQVEFVPQMPPKPFLTEFAEQVGANMAAVYTGATRMPGARRISCVVCDRSSQTTQPKKPGEVSLCSAPCAQAFQADPERYLAKIT